MKTIALVLLMLVSSSAMAGDGYSRTFNGSRVGSGATAAAKGGVSTGVIAATTVVVAAVAVASSDTTSTTGTR